MTNLSEYDAARLLANRVLDDASRDPDSDLSMLARQLLRADECAQTAEANLRMAARIVEGTANSITQGDPVGDHAWSEVMAAGRMIRELVAQSGRPS